MTEYQRDREDARSQLQSLEELAKLTARLRQDRPTSAGYVLCTFCANLVHESAYACKRCGWKVAV